MSELSEPTKIARSRPERGRVANPTLQVMGDLFRHASLRRTWLPLLITALALLAAALIVLGQTVAPWAIYPAL